MDCDTLPKFIHDQFVNMVMIHPEMQFTYVGYLLHSLVIDTSSKNIYWIPCDHQTFLTPNSTLFDQDITLLSEKFNGDIWKRCNIILMFQYLFTVYYSEDEIKNLAKFIPGSSFFTFLEECLQHQRAQHVKIEEHYSDWIKHTPSYISEIFKFYYYVCVHSVEIYAGNYLNNEFLIPKTDFFDTVSKIQSINFDELFKGASITENSFPSQNVSRGFYVKEIIEKLKSSINSSEFLFYKVKSLIHYQHQKSKEESPKNPKQNPYKKDFLNGKRIKLSLESNANSNNTNKKKDVSTTIMNEFIPKSKIENDWISESHYGDVFNFFNVQISKKTSINWDNMIYLHSIPSVWKWVKICSQKTIHQSPHLSSSVFLIKIKNKHSFSCKYIYPDVKLLLKSKYNENDSDWAELHFIKSKVRGVTPKKSAQLLFEKIIEYFQWIETEFWSKGVVFSPTCILRYTTILYNEKSKKMIVCMDPFDYGDFYLFQILKNFLKSNFNIQMFENEMAAYHVNINADILNLLVADPIFLDNENCEYVSQNYWEMGVLLVFLFRFFLPNTCPQVYNALLKNEKYQLSLPSMIYNFVIKGIGDQIMLIPWDYIASDDFAISLSKIFHRNHKKRYSFSNWLKDPITKKWINENHFYIQWKKRLDERYWYSQVNQETAYMERNLLDSKTPTKILEINSSWNCGEELTDTLLFLKNYVGTITSPQFFLLKGLRNYQPWIVNYYIEYFDEKLGKNVRTKEQSSGVGLTQSAICKFSQCIQHLKLFRRRSFEDINSISYDGDPEIEDAKNTKEKLQKLEETEEYWYALGLTIGQALRSELSFQVEVPPAFYKICLYGSNAKFTLSDLARVSTESYFESLQYAKLLSNLDSSEIECIDEDFSSLGDPLRSGPVTCNNIYEFIQSTVQKRIVGTFKPDCMDALKKGFDFTRSDFTPSETILFTQFGKTNLPTVKELFSRACCTYNFPKKIFYQLTKEILHSYELCVENDHYIGDQMCILSSLKKWLTENPDKISIFLEFVTGSKFVTLNHLKQKRIEIRLINAIFNSEMKYPSSMTCTQTFIVNHPVFQCSLDSSTSYKNAVKIFESSINTKMMFGNI